MIHRALTLFVVIIASVLINFAKVENAISALKVTSSTSEPELHSNNNSVTEHESNIEPENENVSTVELDEYSDSYTVFQNITTFYSNVKSETPIDYITTQDGVEENDTANYKEIPSKIIRKRMLSKVVGSRIQAGSADQVLQVKFNINKYEYHDWKSWVHVDENKVYCQNDHHCDWISKEVKCQKIIERKTKAAWFGGSTLQSLGECECPDEFDLGFSWIHQRCEQIQEPWVVIMSSIFICLILTMLILFVAFIQDILVALGLRKRSLSTPNNSSLRKYSSINN